MIKSENIGYALRGYLVATISAAAAIVVFPFIETLVRGDRDQLGQLHDLVDLHFLEFFSLASFVIFGIVFVTAFQRL